jgi:pyridoxal phosphate enzyme (YggS family)
MNFGEKLISINKKIKLAQSKSAHKNSIKIIAVTKTHPFSFIEKSYNSNIYSIGENKVQEAEKKFESFEKMPKIERRFIGHLQSNKVRKCLSLFDTIDTLDSVKLAKKVSNIAKETNKDLTGLIEINTSGENQKKGFLPKDIDDIQRCLNLPNLKIVGLMTIGPNTKNINRIRSAFKKLRELKDLINSKNKNIDLSELSMGMSGDYEVAIEEGSTMIRLGTALFGVRGSL